jgi:hypothetical protein
MSGRKQRWSRSPAWWMAGAVGLSLLPASSLLAAPRSQNSRILRIVPRATTRVASARQELPPSPAPARVAPNLALMGITRVGDRDEVWLVDTRTREREVVGKGQTAFGWTVRRIGTENVTLARGRQTVQLHLGDRSTAPPAGSTVAAAPAAVPVAVPVPVNTGRLRRRDLRGMLPQVPVSGAPVAYPVPVPVTTADPGYSGPAAVPQPVDPGTPIPWDDVQNGLYTYAPPYGYPYGPMVPGAYPYGYASPTYDVTTYPYAVPGNPNMPVPWAGTPAWGLPGGVNGYPLVDPTAPPTGTPNMQTTRRSGVPFGGFVNPNTPSEPFGNPQTLRRRGGTDPSLFTGRSPSSRRFLRQ